MRAIRAISHEIAVMYRGEIVEQGSAQDIFQKPENAYTKELIKASLA